MRSGFIPAPTIGVEWRRVVGDERYSVSSAGHVRRDAPARGARVGHCLRAATSGVGYPVVVLGGGESRRMAQVHRLVAEAFIGPFPPKSNVNHKNGIKTDNRVENLEIVTPKENSEHAIRTGLINNRGESHGMAKLTDAEVLDIVAEKDAGYRQNDIASAHGVSTSTVSQIINGSRWSHVTHRVRIPTKPRPASPLPRRR